MATFSIYYPNLLRNEGGYCNNPNDKGKETYCGISRVANGQWSSWPTIDKIRLQHYPATSALNPVPAADWLQLTKFLKADTDLSAQVEIFYKNEYWDSLGLDGVKSQSIADQAADHGVNAGVMRSGKMLQYLLNTEFGAQLQVDGKVGPCTIAALNAVDQAKFYARFVAMRQAYYNYLAGTTFTPAEEQSLAAWHQFFGQELGVQPNYSRDHGFLPSWISRTKEQFVA